MKKIVNAGLLFQLTEEVLDIGNRADLETLKGMYERYPAVGGRRKRA